MKAGDLLVRYCNMLGMGRMIKAGTRLWGVDDTLELMCLLLQSHN